MKLTMCELVLYKIDAIGYYKMQCERYKTIKKYAMILHDKDVDDKGEPKKPHIHLMLYFGQSFDTDNLLKWFEHVDLKENQIEKIKINWVSALEYLTHKNDDTKYQYDSNDIIANFNVEKEIAEKKRNNNAKLLIQQYSNLEIGFKKMYTQLSPSDKIKLNRDIKLANEVRMLNVNMRSDRDMKVAYVYGQTGSGKTTFAKKYCELLDHDYFVSGSSNDTLDGYMGEEVIILDDLRADSFKFHNLLKFLDNHTSSMVKSRYYNKAIDCKWIIITSIKPIDELYRNQTNEDLLQLYRRINYYITIEKETGKLYERQLDEEKTKLKKQLVLSKPKLMSMNMMEIFLNFKTKLNNRKSMNDYIVAKKA